MAKGETCVITNCCNIITVGRKGRICGTHQWRKRKYGSWDLPNHVGEPNYQTFPELPDGIVKICDVHGDLISSQVYCRYYKGHISSRYCKQCTIEKNVYKKFNGMTAHEHSEMLIKQKNVCAICLNPESVMRNGYIKKLAIDHCHENGKIRGLLCQFCNAGIGYFKDNPELLQSAIIYLKQYE